MEVKNIERYYQKIVISQGIIEVWKYEKLNVNGGGFHEGNGKDKEKNYKQRQRTRRNAIRQLICSNFDSTSKFVTLTFRDDIGHDIRNVKECNLYFKNFILRLKRKFPDFRYLAVIEFQDKNERGAVHYHMVCNLPYIRKSELSDIWDGGFIKINSIDKVDNVGAYVIKYMTADMDDMRLSGLNAYLRSRGLKKPIEAVSWRNDDREILDLVTDTLKRKSPSYSAKYESEHAGHIEYAQYNMNRNCSQKESE